MKEKKVILKPVYREVLKLSLPIALQNIFSTAVTSADVIMVGRISQDALSATSLAGQIQFVLNLIFLGLPLGTSLMVAQYWGRKDMHTIENILGLALKTAVSISMVFGIGACFFSTQLMGLFTADATLISYGSSYLRIVGISYLFMGVSQIYQSVIKAVGEVKKSTLISSTALILNIIFNAILIFGWFGLPKMGVVGAALGTLFSRGIELIWCIWESLLGKSVKIRWASLKARNKILFRDFWKYALPITLNGLSWGSAFATYSIILGHLGSDVVAANSIATVARNFAMVGCNGLASGAGIYLGALLGNDELKKAKEDGSRIMGLTILLGLLGGGLILLASPILVYLVELTDIARGYLRIMLIINAAYVLTKALNVMLNNGIFCAGGDTRFGLICDTIDMWCFSVPLGFICAFLLKLPPMTVYFILCLDELAKLPFAYHHFKGNKWVKNITRKTEEMNYDNG